MTLIPGDLKLKDPDSSRNGQFDWSDFLGVTPTIAGTPLILITGPDAALTADNVALDVTNQKVDYRLTGGTLGRRYTVTSRITTNEVPAQTEDRSIVVLIQQG